ncbi:MAG: DNA-binding protein [Candidatus Eisenbacteria bacterium]
MPSTTLLYAVDKNVYAFRCPKCGALYHPAPMVCRKCRNRRDPSVTVYPDFEKIPLGGPCRLLTWTRIYALPEGIDRPSLAFGVVEFENGIRAVGQLMVENPENGARLDARPGLVRELVGRDFYGLQLFDPET